MNFITNNGLEAVQLQAGPASVVGNSFYTLVNLGPNALNENIEGYGLPVGNILDNAVTFVGNWVYGEHEGVAMVEGGLVSMSATVNCSGNWMNLSPAIPGSSYYPGEVAALQNCETANIFGNKLVTSGYGVYFGTNCGTAEIMNNDFGAVTYCGIGYQYIGDSLNSAQIFSNILGQGVNFHIQLPYTNSFGWFVGSNIYLDINSNSNSVFMDPISSAVHIFN